MADWQFSPLHFRNFLDDLWMEVALNIHFAVWCNWWQKRNVGNGEMHRFCGS